MTPAPAAQHRPARVRAAPARRARHGRRRRRRARAATASTAGWPTSSSRAAPTRRSSTSPRGCPIACPASRGRGGLALRPALVARPAQRGGRDRSRSATRSRAADPAGRAAYAAQRRGLRRPRCARWTRGIAPLHGRRCPPRAAPARDRPRRVRLLRPPLRHHGRRRRDPVADHAGPAVGRATSRGSSASIRRERRAGRLPRELGQRAAGAGDRAADGRAVGPRALRRHARARRARRGRPTCPWSGPTPTRWCAASPAGGRGARSRGVSAAPATLLRADGLAAGYGGRAGADRRELRARARAAHRRAGPQRRRQDDAVPGAARRAGAAGRRARACRRAASVVPQTERSRLDFPVSALDVALMGAVVAAAVVAAAGPRRPRGGPRRAGAGRPGRPRARQLRRPLGRPAPARARGPRAGAGRAGACCSTSRSPAWTPPSAERLEALLDRLAAEGRGLLVAGHDVEQARRWDRVLCLNGRQVAFGAPDVLTREVLEATYGGDVVADRLRRPRHRPRRPAAPPPRARPRRVTLAVLHWLTDPWARAAEPPGAARGRAARPRRAARWAAGCCSSSWPTAPSRSRTRCCPGSSAPRCSGCRCCSAGRPACSSPRSRSRWPAARR